MVEDRDYMRYSGHEPRVSVTISLLVLNVIVYIAQLVGINFFHVGDFEDTYFALSLGGLQHGYVWQLLTFQLMHDPNTWMHLLLNSVALFFFGRAVEGAIGGRKFVTLYFSSGIIGGLFQMLFMFLLHARPDASVVGASAGVSGV